MRECIPVIILIIFLHAVPAVEAGVTEYLGIPVRNFEMCPQRIWDEVISEVGRLTNDKIRGLAYAPYRREENGDCPAAADIIVDTAVSGNRFYTNAYFRTGWLNGERWLESPVPSLPNFNLTRPGVYLAVLKNGRWSFLARQQFTLTVSYPVVSPRAELSTEELKQIYQSWYGTKGKDLPYQCCEPIQVNLLEENKVEVRASGADGLTLTNNGTPVRPSWSWRVPPEPPPYYYDTENGYSNELPIMCL